MNVEGSTCGALHRAETLNAENAGFNLDENGILRSNLLARGLNALHIDILDHGYFYGDERWNQFGIMSPYARLYFMTKDYGWVESGGQSVDLRPGHMYLIPPFVKVNLRTDARIEKFYVHMNCLYADLNLLDHVGQILVLELGQDELTALLNAYEGERIEHLLDLKGILYRIVARFAHACLPDLHGRLVIADRYKELHAYVSRHLSFTLSYKAVAEALKISPNVLRKRYAEDTGLTLTHYIHAQLTQQAALSLLTTQKSIKEIAAELGFTDEFYFSRFFKKRMQYSPREYRRLNGFVSVPGGEAERIRGG